jgi:RNA exonuclease NGL2
VFSKVGELGIKLDDLPLFYPSSSPSTSDPPTHSRKSIGLSRKTRNVALFVALAFNEDKSKGMIVGTTHLFWHPQHVYERARQTGIMLREAKAFRDAGEGWGDWPVVLAGGECKLSSLVQSY